MNTINSIKTKVKLFGNVLMRVCMIVSIILSNMMINVREVQANEWGAIEEKPQVNGINERGVEAPNAADGDVGFTMVQYDNMHFRTPSYTTLAGNLINYNWGGGSPVGLSNDRFSIRWYGKFVNNEITSAEEFTFTLNNDDGVTWWINGEKIVENDWANDGTATYTFEPGVTYDFVYEYYEDGGDARVILEMESASVAKRYVSASDFRQVDLSGIQTQFVDSKAGALADATDYVVESITLLDGNNQPISDQVYVSVVGRRDLVNGVAVEPEEWVLVSESTTAGVYEFNLGSREPGEKEIRVRLGNFPLDVAHTYEFLLADPNSGLQGEYFSNKTLTDPSFAIRDNEVIDFNWENGAPIDGMPGDNYSARWTGHITPDYSETYTFYTYSDDGMRLWIDGDSVVDSWIIQGPTYHSGSYNMIAGQAYEIIVEYYEEGGGAVAGLEWVSASQPREVIYRENLSMPVDRVYNFAVNFSETEVVGNGVDSSMIVATLTDSGGSPIYDANVYIQVSGTGNTINDVNIEDDDWTLLIPDGQKGQYLGDLKSITAEQKTIQFRVGGNVENSEYYVLFTEFDGCLETTETNELEELETHLFVPNGFVCELQGSSIAYDTITVSGDLDITPAVPGGSIAVNSDSITVASGATIRTTDVSSQVTYQTELVNVDGVITANGGYAENGGFIFIDTDDFTGNGSIQANGSGGENPGRGGLIKLNYVSKSYTGTLQVFGGEFGIDVGDPGAIYDVHDGQIYITNNGRYGTAIIPEGVYPLNSIQFEYGTNVIFEGENTEVGLTGSVIHDTGDNPLLTVEGVFHGPTDFVVQNYSFNGKIDTTQNLSFLSPTASTLHAFAVPSSHVFNQFTIGEDVVLNVEPYRVDNGDFSDEQPFVLNANTISIDGAMNTSELGYATKLDPACVGDGPGGGWGICEAASGNSNGGAHGGYGGVGYLVDEIAHPASVPYGSETEPVALGSGGGGVPSMNCAGAGGGAIKLIANTTISLNGQITAHGEHGSVSTGCAGLTGGGGAGGSIWLQSPAITGDGELVAMGGDGIYDGPGSGGRISVDTLQLSETIIVNADPGESSLTENVIPAERGTIYLGAIDYINSSFVANPQDLPYGSGYSSEVTVTVLSTNGHGYPYQTPTIQLINGDSLYVNGQILYTNDSITLNKTDVDGNVIFTATADTYGSREFIITVDESPFVSNGMINFINGDVDPNLSSIEAVPTEVPVGIGAVSEVTVALLSDNGYPVVNEDVTVTLVSGDTMLIDDQYLVLNESIIMSETDGLGELVFNASAETAGQRELVISADGVEMTQHAVISFISTHINADLSTISVTPDVVVADGNAVSVVRLTARDDNNHPISYGIATLIATGDAIVTQPTTTTDINGEAVGYISNATIESVTVTGYITGEVINQTANINFNASDIALSLGGNSIILPGQNVDVQVNVENLTEIPVYNTEISLTLPEQFIYQSDNFQVTPSINGNVYTWNIGQVDKNENKYFSVICLLSASTIDGTNLPVSASIGSDTLENNLSNNSSSKTFVADSGYGFDTELNESSSTLNIGGETTYKVLINNTGLMADQYAISVQGLDSFTTTLSSDLVALNAGGIAEVDITVGSNSCQANTSVNFSVNVTSQSTGATSGNNATLIVDTNPLITLIAPKQNSTSGSRTVLFSWSTNPATTSTLTLYPTGDPGSAQTFITELGTSHSVEVSDLVRHTSYTWYVESQSTCGSGTSLSRSFTVGNGIVFSNHNQNITVDRDYDQRIDVLVSNEDSVAHTLVASVDNSYEDLIVNFVDSGSIDETITLQPGETRTITLAIHAQDAKLYSYQLNAHLIADEGTAIPIEDNANLNVSVLSEGDFSIVEDVAAFDPVQLSRTFIITNNGRTITDLTVEALDPTSGEQANIYLQPTINHARLATGQSIKVVAYPLFSADNVAVEEDGSSHDESHSKDSLAAIMYNLTAKGSGNTVTSSSSAACTGGKSIYPVTVSDQTMTCSSSSWYCTNRPKISTTVKNPFNFNQDSLYSAEVRISYYPRSDVKPHAAQLSVNGTLVESFDNMVPSGSYTSEVPVSAWNEGLAGSVSQNISLSSQHPNGGHYVVSTGFELIANIKQATFYVCAPSIEVAPAYVPTMCDMQSTNYNDARTDRVKEMEQNSGAAKGSNGSTDSGDCPFGECNAQETSGDPINTHTGAFSFSMVDLSFQTSKGNLVFQRNYSSDTVDSYTDDLGFGWTHNHDLQLIFPEAGDKYEDFVRYKGVQGNEYFFEVEEDGSFTAMPGVTATLTKNVDSGVITYHLDSFMQTHLVFDQAGKILQRIDENGKTFDYLYDANNRLYQVAANGGARYLTFGYDTENRITSVTDHTGRGVTFTYDGNGDLASSTDVLGQQWLYTYDSNHRMTILLDPRGVDSANTDYDYLGRAYQQWDGEGNLLVKIRYNADGSTTVYDGAGKAETHYYDNRNVVIKESDPLGGTILTERNDNFQPVQITDQVGNITELEWDDETQNLTKVTNALDEETSLTYDENNNITSVVDAKGNESTYTYNGMLLTSATDVYNNTTSFTYDADGNVETITDAHSNTTTYDYNEYGQLISQTDVEGHSNSYIYDDLGRLILSTDASGISTYNEYNAAGWLMRSIRNYDAARVQNEDNLYNITTTYTYDASGNMLTMTDTYGAVYEYQYDNNNRVIKMIDAGGGEIEYEYDDLGRKTAEIDQLDRRTSYTYDSVGRVVAVTNALGNTNHTTYNTDGTVAYTTNALGQKTSYTYDALQRVIAVTDNAGNTTHTVYDEVGNMVESIDAMGRSTTYEYDNLNRMVRQTDPAGNVTESVYDEIGNLVQSIDARDGTTTYVYDDLNRMVSTSDAMGNTTSYTYDALGRQSMVTDAKGRTTSFDYDILGRQVTVTDYLGNTSTSTYDALGRMLTSEDAMGHVYTSVYDSIGRLDYQINPLGGETHYTYDAVGNQLSVTDANGHTTSTVYDALNRVVSISDANGHSQTTSYNAIGNVTAVSDAAGNSVNYVYDNLNRQTSIIDANDNQAYFTYNVVGNRLSTIDANGIVTRYEYDQLNRLSSILENFAAGASATSDTNVRTSYGYDENGNRTTIMDGNGNTTTFTYDALNRLISETDALGHVTQYTYDELGNQSTVIDANGATITYQYDELNRLVLIDYPDPDADVSFTYNAIGQQTSMVDGLGTTTWQYDDLGRTISVTDPFGAVVGYSYDAVGNRTGLTYPDGKSVTYTYDPANLLLSVMDWNDQETQYSYNSVNRIVGSVLPNGLTSTYSYDPVGNLLSLTHQRQEVEYSSYTYTYDAVGNRTSDTEMMKIEDTTIFADGFESGDLSAWSSAQTDGGNLAVVPFSWMEGGSQLVAHGNGLNEMYVQDDHPLAESDYNARFYLHLPHVWTLPDGSFVAFQARDAANNPVVQVRISKQNEQFLIGLETYDDNQQIVSSSMIPTITQWHGIEVEWHASSAPDANDGYATLYVDDIVEATITDIDNDTRSIDTATMGILSPSAGDFAGEFFFDDFTSNRGYYIGLNPNVMLPLVLKDTFESGDMSAWSTVQTDGINLSVSSVSPIEGNYSLNATVNGQNEYYVQDDNPADERNYNARLYINPESLAIQENEYFDILKGIDPVGTSFAIRLGKINSDYRIKLVLGCDDGTMEESVWIPIERNVNQIELEWWRASGADATNGGMRLWVNGINMTSIEGKDSDTRSIESVLMGVLSPSSSSISGSIIFDSFISTRILDPYLGLDPSITMPDYSQIFFETFESGDFTAWDSAETDGGNLGITSNYPIEGTYSMQATVNGQNEMYVHDDHPLDEIRYTARFYVNPENLVIPPNEYFDIFRTGGSNGAVFTIRLSKIDGNYVIKALIWDDNNIATESDWISINNGPNCIELGWFRAPSAEDPNGRLKILVNDQWKAFPSGVGDITKSVNYAEMGILSPSSTNISGTVTFDAFGSTDWGDTGIGLDPNADMFGSKLIFYDAFENGNLLAWNSAQTDGDNLSVVPFSWMEGGSQLVAHGNGLNEMYVEDDHPQAESHYDARFYLHLPYIWALPDGSFVAFQTRDAANNPVVQIRVSKQNEQFMVGLETYDDNQQIVSSSLVPIMATWHAFEVEWHASSAPGANDGYGTLYVDDIVEATITGLDNDTMQIDSAVMGILNPSAADFAGEFFFDDFTSNRLYHIGLNPNVKIPLVVKDDFESGDLSVWSSVQTDGINLGVSSSSPIEGNYSLQATVNGQYEYYVQDDNPTYERNYNVRFYINPESLVIPEGEHFDILKGLDPTGTSVAIQLGKINGDYRIRMVLGCDDGTTAESAWVPIKRTLSQIEMEWWRAAAADNTNGGMRLWVNDIYKTFIEGKDNDTRSIESVLMGVLSPSSSTMSGNIIFDGFVSARITDIYIGPDPDITIPENSQLFFDTFESGDLSVWDSAETNSGDLSIISTSPIEGSYSLQADADGLNEMYVHDDHPLDIGSYSARFYFDPKTVVIPQNEHFDIFRAVGSGGQVFAIRLTKIEDDYAIKAVIWDNDNNTTESIWTEINNGPNCIELGWFRAWSPEVPDGRLQLWVNGTRKEYPGDIDSYNRTVNYVEMGVLSPSSANISGMVTFDDFDSTDWGDNIIGLDPNVTLPNYVLFVSDGFESGDMSAWSSAETDSGDLSVTMAAALDGNYGLQAIMDDQNEMYVEDSSPTSEQYYNARFYVDPNSVVISGSDTFDLLRGGGLGGEAFSIRLGWVNDAYAVKLVMVANDNSTVESAWIPINDGVNYIEVEWRRANHVNSNDGWANFWVNNNGWANPNGIGNGAKTIGYVQMGVLSPTSGNIDGTVYFDDFASRNSGYIGRNAVILLNMSSMPMLPETENLPLPTMTATAISTQAEEVVSSTPEPENTVTETMTTEAPEPSLTSTEAATEIIETPQPEPQLEDTSEPEASSEDTGMQMEDTAEPMLLSMSGESQIDITPDPAQLNTTAEIEDTPTAEQTADYTDTVTAAESMTESTESPEPEITDEPLPDDTGDETEDQRSPGRPSRHTATLAPTPQPSETPVTLKTPQPSSTALPSNTPWVEQLSATPLPSSTPGWTPSWTPTNTITSTFSATPLANNTPTSLATATWTLTFAQDTQITKVPEIPETDLRLMEMALSAMLIQQPGSVTIDYTYDGLYRLTDAEYSNGDYYRYTYDAVGNRLTQETIEETNTYTYDAANRMTSVDGVTYTWDANGNMLSDGISTYTYDHANRLTGVSGTNVSSFTYNGLGDRYQQIVNSATTTYQLDLAAGLVNVLADGENTYLYGNTVVAQVSDTQTGYYLPDVLGSVRQMTSPTGEVQLSQRFTPFGEVKEKYGDGEAAFGYTGQMYDEQTGLLYLRARYYAPGMGRFISHDAWSGDSNMPMSYNAWLYGYGNPVRYVDPSGKIPSSEDVKKGHILYTTNAGFVDLGHFGASAVSSLLKQIYADDSVEEKRKWFNDDYYEVTISLNVMAVNPVHTSLTVAVRDGLSDSQKDSVALGIWMELNKNIEDHQIWITKYSFEDLSSDLIGFYVGKTYGDVDIRYPKEKPINEKARRELAHLLGFNENVQKSIDKSVEVFEQFKKGKFLITNPIRIEEWGKYLHFCEETGKDLEMRDLPSEITAIKPITKEQDNSWFIPPINQTILPPLIISPY